jgi:peptidyl-prolyl cis-trans isomerase C
MMPDSVLQNQSVQLNYQILRVALDRFKKTPRELDAGQLQQVQELAQKQFALETMVMKSDEACEIVIPATVVDEAIKKVEERYTNHDEFIEELSQNALDMTSLRKALHRELFVEAVLDRVGSRAPDINELDIAIYYHMHRERFKIPETRMARHILITINEDFPENTRAEALARLETIARRLRNKPKRFADLASRYSECPTAMNGGLLGRLGRGKLYKELDEVLFELKPGQVSDIVESPLGLHLLLCEEIHRPAAISMREATAKITDILKKRGRRMCQKHWLGKLADRGVNYAEGAGDGK